MFSFNVLYRIIEPGLYLWNENLIDLFEYCDLFAGTNDKEQVIAFRFIFHIQYSWR